jgi:hypothetical protein
LISSTTKRKKDQIHKFKIKTQILQPIWNNLLSYEGICMPDCQVIWNLNTVG